MRFLQTAAVMLAAAGLTLPVLSETTRRWEQSSSDDFRKGKAENISIRSDGKLMLAPRLTEHFEPPAAYLWTLAEDSKGNIFAGGGPGARVFRIGADGRKSTFFERDNVDVHALAIDAEDNIYAATSPSGKVYKIDPSGGYDVFFDPDAEYIWDLAFDKAGNLFVATGDQGKIFRVTPDGKGELYFETGETHVRSMLFDNDGNLIVGTDPNALIIRVTLGQNGPSGFVAYQSSKKEVTALVLGTDGSIYAAGVGNRQGAAPRRRVTRTTTTAVRPTTATPPATQPNQQPTSTPTQAPVQAPAPSALLTRVTGGSEVVRILPDGEPREVWSDESAIVYALGLDKDGKVLVATGDQGRLFRVESETVETLVATMPSEQITALLQRPSGAVVMATSNVGKIYELGPDLAESGTFESDVLDAEGFTRWGRLEWDNQLPDGAAIRVTSRSGNLETPSNHWSGWGNPADMSEGGQTGAPSARFLQWRASLSRSSDQSPLLDAVRVYYLPKNVRPTITHLEATPPNYRFASSSSRSDNPRSLVLPPLGQPAVRRVRTVSPNGAPMTRDKGRLGARWVADDENDDDLAFKIEIRGEGEQNWRLLEEEVADEKYDWDSTSFADGLYRVRVTASDAPANPSSEALTFSKISEPFAIDNTAPAIRDLAAERDGEALRVRFTAADSASMLERAEYSLDGADWEQVLPSTRLFDSQELSFDFATGEVESGEHTVAVRVYDRFDNLATAKVVVR